MEYAEIIENERLGLLSASSDFKPNKFLTPIGSWPSSPVNTEGDRPLIVYSVRPSGEIQMAVIGKRFKKDSQTSFSEFIEVQFKTDSIDLTEEAASPNLDDEEKLLSCLVEDDINVNLEPRRSYKISCTIKLIRRGDITLE